MHKIISIFTIIISVSANLFSYSAITITSQADWEAGQASTGLSTGQTGAIRLSAGFINGYDDFNGGYRPWWTMSNGTPTFANGNVFINAIFNTMYPRAGLWSSAFPASQDFSSTVNIFVGGVGAMGVEVGPLVAGVQVVGQLVSFPGSTGGISANILPLGWAQLQLRKNGTTYVGEYRIAGSNSWTYLGARDLSPGPQTLFLGIHNEMPAPGSNAYFDNFEVTPIVGQGTWTSTALNLSGAPTTQGIIKWSQDLPTGTLIKIQTATSTDGLNWSNWSDFYANNSGSNISSPNRQYIRVAATLYADANREFSPVLNDITIVYPDALPLRPTLSSSTHPRDQWSNKNLVSLSWAMPSTNPAPESAYKYWLAVGTSVTLTAAGAGLSMTTGLPHTLSFVLPQEGLYTFGLTVTADAFSGALTTTAIPYLFNFDATPPGQVTISSPTHPALLFTNNNSPVFKLSAYDALSGVSGYAAILDKAASGDPGFDVNNGEDIRFSRLDNGTFYLHARAIDMAGNTGPVSHYGIRIDFNGALLSPDYVKALPNPVRSNTARLEYELAAPATEVYLEFVNSQGDLLKTVDGTRIIGKNYYSWDVSALANGVYLFRVRAKSSEDGKAYSAVRKVAVIR